MKFWRVLNASPLPYFNDKAKTCEAPSFIFNPIHSYEFFIRLNLVHDAKSFFVFWVVGVDLNAFAIEKCDPANIGVSSILISSLNSSYFPQGIETYNFLGVLLLSGLNEERRHPTI